MTLKSLILFLILIPGVISAQEFKINKITKADFEEKRYKADSTATAVIDYNIGNTYFEAAGNNLQIVTITKTRIKIFTKNAYDYATVKIPLYREQSSRELLTVTNAFTYNLENGEIEKTKLNTTGEFLEKVEGNHYVASFTMPNVKEGSIIEYTTKITSPYFTFVPEWYFQYDIPVRYSEFTLKIPQKLYFYKYIKGTEKISQLTLGDSYVFKGQNIPALKEEGFITNINNYRSSVMHAFSGYKSSNGTLNMFAGTWEDVIKNINNRETFGGHLKNNDFELEFVNSLITGKNTYEQKTKAIVDFVKNNFEWNQNIGIDTEKNLREVFKTKAGSASEINFLTIALLRSARIQAFPIILATRSKGISYMPHADAFNNVIIGVEEAGKTFLYDATDKFAGKDILPIHNLNWIGRLIKNDGTSKDILLEPQVESKYSVNAYLDLNTDDGSISGIVRRNYNNYEAYLFRSRYSKMTNDKIAEKIEERYGIQVDSININNMNDVDLNIEEFIKLKKENSFDNIGDKIYISPAFIFTIDENPFKLDKRTYPMDFLYPNKNNYTMNLNIPEGYVVDFVPQNKKIESASNAVSAKWIINQDAKKIQIKWSLDYNKAYVDSKEYQDIKIVFEELVKFMGEKIVLKKI